MELYHLKSFLAVAAEQHLTRAAKRLHISQSSVSVHIKDLEQELCLTLFIRTPKGMILTPEGRIIRSEAEAALQSVESVKHLAGQLKQIISGDVNIGLNLDAQFLKIAELNKRLQQTFPDVSRRYYQRHSLEAHDHIQKARLDVALCK